MTPRVPFAPIVTFLVLFICSCARPIAPTGGPPDRTPPEITSSDPANETVNFDGRRIRISFSKFVNRASFMEAVEVEPDLGIGFDVSWRRQTAILEFERTLPENTTIIIHIGTELSDTRNNSLDTPYRIAISTGDEIDDGEVTARIRHAADGSSDTGYRVFLYREPFDFAERANYVAQSDTAGRVRFSYLAADNYKAIWVDDLNRDRRWDPERERAQPFHEETFTLERSEQVDLGTIFIERPDTTRPQLQGIGLLTGNRLRLRFNEEVFWDEASVIRILDTLGNAMTEAYPLYVLPDDDRIVLAQSVIPLDDEEHSYVIRPEGFSDRAGNPSRVTAGPIGGSVQADTVGLRIIGDNRDPGLFRDEPLIVGYNKWIDDSDVLDSLRVVAGDRMIEPWPHAETDRHRLSIYPDGVWESGIAYQFLVWNPYREQLRPIEPVIWQSNQLGALEITVAESDDDAIHHLTLFDREGKIDMETTFGRSILLEELPPLYYTVVIFRDVDGSGDWQPGSVDPYVRPEPYFVRTDLPVREGFVSELEVEFGVRDSARPSGDQETP